MYPVTAQGVDERMINVHYYYYSWLPGQTAMEVLGQSQDIERDSRGTFITLAPLQLVITGWLLTTVSLATVFICIVTVAAWSQ